jgi:ubiquinone/menaquinone biosynthesis C-methylase UbiE
MANMINEKEAGILNDRKPHAVLDVPTRLLKGRKIELLLNRKARPGARLRLLEIGTGSGGIASYFVSYAQQAYDVDAVDVVDNRLTVDGYRFQLVNGTQLPFDNATFDIVITNHVIEHVGSYDEQMRHLAEVVRVMKPDATGYLAVPNRWMLVEPHYRLIFLSWLPHSWRSAYLKRMRGVDFYDCEPLELGELERMMADTNLVYQNRCVEAMKLMQSLEKSESVILKLCNSLPEPLLKPLLALIPTLIYTFTKR